MIIFSITYYIILYGKTINYSTDLSNTLTDVGNMVYRLFYERYMCLMEENPCCVEKKMVAGWLLCFAKQNVMQLLKNWKLRIFLTVTDNHLLFPNTARDVESMVVVLICYLVPRCSPCTEHQSGSPSRPSSPSWSLPPRCTSAQAPCFLKHKSTNTFILFEEPIRVQIQKRICQDTIAFYQSNRSRLILPNKSHLMYASKLLAANRKPACFTKRKPLRKTISFMISQS